jgi:putative transposase
MGAHHDAGLVVAALNMAAVTRDGTVDGVIFHSDRDSEEYTSADFEGLSTGMQWLQS